ncbi:sigma-54 dependent transcription activator protein [Herbaspirillum frisingense GSF30]|uniref:Sigma-54 dependent transcription activator protein n=1 Tax=Herbaspirillum frisingense GSF30 TaxID=864073 RepID=A0AAI9N3K9_9BURK|nr:sigma-54-dependent Fis family transcriptional regulator [Herbaspirillum frisingense]EOA04583.1 sigma-54 dependent transcription activator protein [Herbaspirillum frisingense GSF30]
MQYQANRPGAGALLGAAPLVQATADGEPDLQAIARSHQRSSSYGITRGQRPDLEQLSRADLAQTLEASQSLSGHARPVMETLYDQIRNTHSMVILSDAEGTIIHTLGDRDFLAKADRVALGPGGRWSEQLRGTNAIGTALFEQKPTTVHAQQHYLDANRFLTCSAAPIFDHRGKVLGVLDVSGECGSFHKHTMALVRMSAQMIENHLLAGSFPDCITLHFHSRAEFVGTLVEGIVSFTPGGRFLAANRSAQFQLGLTLAALQSHTFTSLFGVPLSLLFEQHRKAAPGLLELCLHNGIRIHGRAELRLRDQHFQNAREAVIEAPELGTAPAAAAASAPALAPACHPPAVRGPADLPDLQALETGDARMSDIIGKLRRVIDRAIPVLITGETGTGKEWLAQAIHRASACSRRAQSQGMAAPFVAVNCSAIPENLIEAELFGYEDGAFTGARRKGAIGKIAQAQGGTLFLDEIGDMPLSLQGRLLRVLQERAVTPLGSQRVIPVEFALVCATNQPLREMAARHAFREDLYYRINGLQVRLPALRERSDLDCLIERILQEEGGPQAPRFDAQALALLHASRWPGNLRQLSNLVRTALAMAEGEAAISLRHLPDDFLEDAAASSPLASVDDEPPSPPLSMQDTEWAAIERALRRHDGNVSAAAKALGVSRNTLYRRFKSRGH